MNIYIGLVLVSMDETGDKFVASNEARNISVPVEELEGDLLCSRRELLDKITDLDPAWVNLHLLTVTESKETYDLYIWYYGIIPRDVTLNSGYWWQDSDSYHDDEIYRQPVLEAIAKI